VFQAIHNIDIILFHAYLIPDPQLPVSRRSVKMSTRSRTRSGLLPKVSESPSVKPVSKSRGNEQSDGMDVDSHNGDGKENIKSLATRSSVAPLSGIRKSKARKPKVRESLRTVDCTCTKGDDGSPMVYCSECRIWWVIGIFFTYLCPTNQPI
jgi:hypothetical protein